MSNRRKLAPAPLDLLPCGCRIGLRGTAFVIEPCSADCKYYRYAVEETMRAGKPAIYGTAEIPAGADLAPDEDLSQMMGAATWPLFEARPDADGRPQLVKHEAFDVVLGDQDNQGDG